MIEKLKEIGLSEETAEKVIELLKSLAAEENEKNEGEKEEIPPMGKTDEFIPTKEEFAKMGYLARLELANNNPDMYNRLKNNI